MEDEGLPLPMRMKEATDTIWARDTNGFKDHC